LGGTFLNETQLKPSARVEIKHLDKMWLGKSICLSLHIHTGQNTCVNCEPGEVMHKLKLEREKLNENAQHNYQTRADLDKQRKEATKLMKKKFVNANLRFSYQIIILHNNYIFFVNYHGIVNLSRVDHF
jgi:hypothetical protein